jgi:hypothetical protein
MIRPGNLVYLFILLLTNITLNKSFGQKAKIFIVQGDTINLANDTAIRNKLVKLNLRQFNDRTVGEILKNDTIRLYKKYWFSDEPPGHLSTLNLTFARGLYLEIWFDQLKYQPSFLKTPTLVSTKFLKRKSQG